jgi:hypothetical protein
MFKKHLFSLFLATLVLVVGCSKNEEPAPKVDPTNPDALTSVLEIPNSSRVKGSPPQPSLGTRPSLTTSQSSVSIAPDNTMYIPCQYTVPSGSSVAGVYLMVNGATSYFKITNLTAISGIVLVPVRVPANVITGSFRMTYCIYDNQNRVSNTLITIVKVVAELKSCPAKEEGADGLTIFNYDLGTKKGEVELRYWTYNLPDRVDVFYNNKWVGGSGSAIRLGVAPPVSTCSGFVDGYVSTGGSSTTSGAPDYIYFDYDPALSRKVTVYVSGCVGSTTKWNIELDCPQ